MFKNLFKKKSPWIYKLLDEARPTSILGVWEKHLWHYTEVIGYTATGTIFLHSPEKKEFIAFYPSMPGNNCKNYGVFISVLEFEEKILKHDTFHEFGLYPIDLVFLNEVFKKLGPLEDYQVYFPKLDLELGGSLEKENFGKGDIWVRTDILGQNRGIE